MDLHPAATGDSAKKRIPELDGLRAVAIAAVFLHHACRAPLLWAGVDIFFVLSGFLITGILLERKARGGAYFKYFYERRVRRILPPYYLALLLSSLLFGWAWLHRWYWFAFFATNVGESIRRSHFSLQPLWSLAVEEQFYFVWPVVILLVAERNLRRICIAMLFVAPLLRILCTPLFHNHFPIYFLTPFRADLLCAGALIALIWRDDRLRLAAWGRWGWVLVVAGMPVSGVACAVEYARGEWRALLDHSRDFCRTAVVGSAGGGMVLRGAAVGAAAVPGRDQLLDVPGAHELHHAGATMVW
jgi:peptidoglycan/LPS O-acetylase OafA/YrhL